MIKSNLIYDILQLYARDKNRKDLTFDFFQYYETFRNFLKNSPTDLNEFTFFWVFSTDMSRSQLVTLNARPYFQHWPEQVVCTVRPKWGTWAQRWGLVSRTAGTVGSPGLRERCSWLRSRPPMASLLPSRNRLRRRKRHPKKLLL